MLALCIGIWLLCIVKCVLFRKYSLVIRVRNHHYNIAHYLLEIAVLMGVFMLITANRTGSDIVNYYNRYTYLSGGVSSTEYLYSLASMVGRIMGLNFYVFRALLTFVTGIIEILILKKLGGNCIWFFLIFYIPSQMFMDSMQVQNSLAFSFFLAGMYFLTDDNTTKGIVCFVVAMIVAIGFHTMFVFYLPLLIYMRKNRSNNRIVGALFVFCALTVALVTLLNNNSVPFISTIYSLLLSDNDNRRTLYLTTGHFGFLYPTALLLIALHLISSICKNLNDADGRGYRFLNISKLATQLTFCSVPFVMMNMNYYRISRNTFILAIISTIIFIKNRENEHRLKARYVFELALLCFLWWFFEIYIYQSSEKILDPIIKYGVWFFQ